MNRTLVVVVVAVLVISWLGITMAQSGDEDGDTTPADRPPASPILTDPATIPPDTTPGTPDARPSKDPSSAAPPRPTGSLSPNEPVPDDFTPQPKLVQPRSGMENLHRTGWDRAEVLGDKKVRLHFVSGVEPCTVLDHVEVKPDGARLVITLFEGNDPAARDTACIMIAQFKAVDVTLQEALAGRTIVDGAD